MAEDKIQEIGKVLADETRVATLQYILSAHHPVSVLDVAVRFKLHPNAARLHLAKLEGMGLVASQMRRNPEGGRPAKLYQPGEKRVEIQVPPRQFCLIATLFLRALRNGGGQTKMEKRVGEIGKAYGQGVAQTGAGLGHAVTDWEQAVEMWLAEEKRMGSLPEVSNNKKGEYAVRIYNCVFEEVAEVDPALVCKLHHGILMGILDSTKDKVVCEILQTKVGGGDCCRMSVSQK